MFSLLYKCISQIIEFKEKGIAMYGGVYHIGKTKMYDNYKLMTKKGELDLRIVKHSKNKSIKFCCCFRADI